MTPFTIKPNPTSFSPRPILCFMLILGLSVTQSWAQRWDLGIGIGATNYKGDVAPEVKLDNTSFGGNINLRYNFNYSFAMKGNLGVFGLRGHDRHSNDILLQNRDYGFKSTNGELSLQLEYNFFNFGEDIKRQSFSPYVFAGGGLLYTNIREQGNAPDSINSALMPVLPFGVGIKHMVNNRLMLVWEFKTVKTFSDQLDGIFDNDTLPQLQRVPRTDFDTYYFFGVSISYKFYGIECPPHLAGKKKKRNRKSRRKGPKDRSNKRANPF